MEEERDNRAHKKRYLSQEGNEGIFSIVHQWRKIRPPGEQLPALTGPAVRFDAWWQRLLEVSNKISGYLTFVYCCVIKWQRKPMDLILNWRKPTESKKKKKKVQSCIFSTASLRQRALPNSHSIFYQLGSRLYKCFPAAGRSSEPPQGRFPCCCLLMTRCSASCPTCPPAGNALAG